MHLLYLVTTRTFGNHASRFMAKDLVSSGLNKRLGSSKTSYHRFFDNKVSDSSVNQIMNLGNSISDLCHAAKVGVIYIGSTDSFQESYQGDVAFTSDRPTLTGLLHLD